jgi:hypothetical protein
MSKFSVNDIKYFTNGNHTLMVGSIETNTPPPHSITLKPRINSTTHVVLAKNNLGYFRSQMASSPVTSNAVYAYDQMGNIVSRYEATRKNNSTGTLDISVEPVTLLSNISFPDVDASDSLFLPLTSYSGLYGVVSQDYRTDLLRQDIEMFRSKTNLSKVTLVIGKTLCTDLKSLLHDYDDYFVPLFKSVVVTEDSSVVSHIVELICGKIVSGHRASFQGFMNFGSNYEVVHSTVCPSESKVEEVGRVSLTNRRGGRLQVYVDGQRGLASFIIILRRTDSSSVPPSFFEETTATTFDVKSDMAADSSTFPGLPMIFMKDYLDTIHFQEDLHAKTESKQIAFIQENTSQVVRYLFTNPHTDVEDSKSLSGMSRAIYNDYAHLMSVLRSTLEHNMHSSRTYSPVQQFGLGLGRHRGVGMEDYLHVASSVPVPSGPYIGRTPSGVDQ